MPRRYSSLVISPPSFVGRTYLKLTNMLSIQFSHLQIKDNIYLKLNSNMLFIFLKNFISEQIHREIQAKTLKLCMITTEILTLFKSYHLHGTSSIE